MLRGRIVSANGITAEDLKPTPDAAWVLQSDRGITYTDDIPHRLACWSKGEWWGRITTARRWSRSRRSIAEGLGLKLGDPVTVNVLGRNITATHRQSAHGRLAEPRHQFRPGLIRPAPFAARRIPISRR